MMKNFTRMMIVGMMMLGTTTCFAKSNKESFNNNHVGPHKEVVVYDTRHQNRNHMDDRNRYDRHYEDRRHYVHHDGRNVKVIEVVRHDRRPLPPPPPARPVVVEHRTSTGGVVAGVVAGAVIGGIISAITR